jgi:hypothetical protein
MTVHRVLTTFVATVIAIAAAAPPVHARPSSDEEEAPPDARLTGYDAKVDIGGGVAASYAMIAVLGAIALGVTFKNARRTHLD